MKIKLSSHGKIRMRERTEYNHKERRMLFKRALEEGKSLQEIEDKEVKAFVNSKQGKCKIKLYRDYLFIYSKNSHQLYTMYRLPDKLVGKERYR